MNVKTFYNKLVARKCYFIHSYPDWLYYYRNAAGHIISVADSRNTNARLFKYRNCKRCFHIQDEEVYESR